MRYSLKVVSKRTLRAGANISSHTGAAGNDRGENIELRFGNIFLRRIDVRQFHEESLTQISNNRENKVDIISYAAVCDTYTLANLS